MRVVPAGEDDFVAAGVAGSRMSLLQRLIVDGEEHPRTAAPLVHDFALKKKSFTQIRASAPKSREASPEWDCGVVIPDGKTVDVDRTDAEGRLAACGPKFLARTLDAATCASSPHRSFPQYTTHFAPSPSEQLYAADETQHDSLWRVSLDDDNRSQTGSKVHSCKAVEQAHIVEGIPPFVSRSADQVWFSWWGGMQRQAPMSGGLLSC
uniref:Uncharacterized protein n=1 Tax=Mycena chlorophos TaxID=658473 RepID=A0ABQ0LAX7_MYCCL|nr:predicted protein [Mycena chlorophos]